MAKKLSVPKAQKLSILLIIAAIGYFYLQVEYGFEKAKVDENAVQAEWVKPLLVEQFRDTFGANEKAFRSKCSSRKKIKKWIAKTWNKYSITNHIFNDRNYTDSSIIYGIHKSPFSDGKTSTIIGLTFDIEDIAYACAQTNYKRKKALSSLSAFVTLSTALSKVNWLSKDVIFVLIERQNFDYRYQQNQLSQYKHSSYLLFDSFANKILPKHASIAVGALIIEIPLYSQSKVLSMNIAGAKGFQPNYDIVATTMVTFTRAHFTLVTSPYFSNSFWNNNNKKGNMDINALESADNLRKSMIRSMSYQAVGKSNGYHGYLIKHRIDAMSLVSFDYYNGADCSADTINSEAQIQISTMFNICRAIELFTRSMSNLIEIFHHATFNYIIISQSKFITMAKYSITIGAIGLSPLIEAAAIYMNCYPPFFDNVLFSAFTLFIAVLFGIYTYVVIVAVNIFCNEMELFYIIIATVFLIIIGVLIILKIWHMFGPKTRTKESKNDYYVSMRILLSIYSMLSQIWLPVALNFSVGLYFVIVTAAMLLIVRKTAKVEIKSKDVNESDAEQKEEERQTVFMAYDVKYKWLRMMLLIAVPIAAIYGIMFLMDIDLLSLMRNLKYDLLNETIYNKHPAWIVLFFTIVPTYLGCWFLLAFT